MYKFRPALGVFLASIFDPKGKSICVFKVAPKTEEAQAMVNGLNMLLDAPCGMYPVGIQARFNDPEEGFSLWANYEMKHREALLRRGHQVRYVYAPIQEEDLDDILNTLGTEIAAGAAMPIPQGLFDRCAEIRAMAEANKAREEAEDQ